VQFSYSLSAKFGVRSPQCLLVSLCYLLSSSFRLYPALFSFFSRCSKYTHNTQTNIDTKTRARQRVVYRDVRRRKNTHTSVQQNTFFMMWLYSSSSSSSSIFVLPIASAAASALLLGGVFSIILAKLVVS
jgi:hypothetical protein